MLGRGRTVRVGMNCGPFSRLARVCAITCASCWPPTSRHGRPAVTKRTLTISHEQAWFDIVSYGRRGPGQRTWLGSANYEAIARTTGNVPEVMVKVTGGGCNIRQVRDEID